MQYEFCKSFNVNPNSDQVYTKAFKKLTHLCKTDKRYANPDPKVM